MTTKLTLTIEDKVIKSAKKYAQSKGESLSHLVENYLKSISSESKKDKQEDISPKILKLMGVLKIPEGFAFKSQMGSLLAKKHSK